MLTTIAVRGRNIIKKQRCVKEKIIIYIQFLVLISIELLLFLSLYINI